MSSVAQLLSGFLALPPTDIAGLLGGGRALVLAPHPDDESLGCGGLIAAACAAGMAPVVVILTDGAASHPGSTEYPPARLRGLREAEAARATGLLGLPRANLCFLAQPDTKLAARGAAFEALVTTLLEIAVARQCATIIAPWAGDPHCDHQAAASIAEALARRGNFRLLSYPVWGWLRNGDEMQEETRRGGRRLDISPWLEVKRQAIAAHESQYGALIKDSPDGFRLPPDLLAVFARSFEVFIA